MADNISIQEQLKSNNPFLSVASPQPWDNNMPDVNQLNLLISTEIEQLIRNKRREPSLPLSGLIFGGQGMGKTHMLTRILRRLRNNAWHAIFVTVRAFTNVKRITQELLSEILICLKKTHSGERSQFDMLMSEMMNVYHERRREDGIEGDNASSLEAYLKQDMPDMSRVFLKCILRYIGTSDKAARVNILDWLRDGLDDEDCLALGLPMRDVYSMDDDACESAAKNIIVSLGILLSYARIPMIICFDQLDAMEGKKELIAAWGDTVGFLMNHIYGVLPLCFVREGVWDSEFIPVLQQPIIQRLKTNIMVMDGCTIPQAKQLIHDRIASSFKDGVEEKYNWLISRMTNMLQSGFSPRMVIEVAGKTIRDKPLDPIKEAYSEEFKKVQSEPRAWPPNSDHMALAARTWLEAHEGCEISGTTWEKYIKIFGSYGDQYIAFAMPVPKTASTATAFLNKCFKFLNEYSGSFCCYVKEEKAHKPTWKVFGARLEEFRKTGGRVIELDAESRLTWYALTALINRINNGDVSIYTASGSGSRPATLDDARDFIRSINLVPGIFAPAQNTEAPTPQPQPKPQPPQIDPDILRERLLSVIKSSPMKILTAEKALTLLAGKKIHITRNELLAYVNTHKDFFRIYTSKGKETMLGLAGK